MRYRLYVLAAGIGILLLTGCATQRPGGPAPVEEPGAASGAQTAGAATAPAVGGGELSGAPAGAPADLLSRHRVHFAFDSSALDAEARAIITAHAQYLVAHPGINVLLDGNTDERGTREYNLALGQRRANAVARLMELLGVAANRITTVSYGQEKPIALGHNEDAWRQNRRVGIHYPYQPNQ